MKKEKTIAAVVFCLAVVFAPRMVFSATSSWSDVSGVNKKNGLVSDKKGAETSLAASDNGRVYVAFEDKVKKNRARVKMFNGVSWQDLADAQNPSGWVSAGRGGNPALETNGENVYVAFMDYGNRQRARVRKWDGSAWQDLADENHPEGYISDLRGFEPALSFDRSKNFLYAAFRDEANDEKEKVMKWSESSGWQVVAGPNNPGGFASNAVASEIDIKSSQSDDGMFAAFEDRSNGSRIRVRKWDGSAWQDLADENHPEGYVSSIASLSPSIDTDSLGNLYLVYTGKNNKNTYIHKWDGSHWSDLEGGIAVRGATIESTIALDERDYLYLAYSQKAGGAWRVRMKVWDGSRWFEAGEGKGGNVSRGRGKGDSSLATYGNKVYMSFTDARNKNRARVKMLNFEP